MDPLFIRTFWITLVMLWVALIILYFVLTGRRSLEKKGHHEKYIEYLRKAHLIRICIIAVVLPLLILLSAWIVSLLSGPLTREVQLAYIVITLVILVIPFKYIDERINQKKIRELALETHEKVAVDVNYRTLHLIFNPLWELILGPTALFYGIFYLRIEQWIIYLFLLIPWFMYLNIRGTRYQTRPYLKDNYTYLFAFNIFNFLFFLLYFCSYYLIRLQGRVQMVIPDRNPVPFSEWLPDLLLLLAGFLIIIALLGRVAIYLAQYRAFLRSIDGREGSDTPFSRKLAFIAGGILILLVLTGTALMTGLVRQQRTEVGVVLEKYLLLDHQDGCDTLLVIREKEPGPVIGNFQRQFPDGLRMTGRIRLSIGGEEKEFGICCPSLFEELPVGSVVKFEYTSGPVLTALVE